MLLSHGGRKNRDINSNRSDSMSEESLADRLEIDHLVQLRRHFLGAARWKQHKRPSLRGKDANISSTRLLSSGGALYQERVMTQQDFLNAIEEVLGTSGFSQEANTLFLAVAKSNGGDCEDVAKLGWYDLLDHLVSRCRKRVGRRQPQRNLLQHPNKYKLLTLNRRELTITMIVLNPSVYLTTSTSGIVGTYDSRLQLHKTYRVPLDDPGCSQWVNKPVAEPWLTDATFLSDSFHVVYSISNRALHFYDASASVHLEEFKVHSLPAPPTRLQYVPASTSDGESLLLWGDSGGGVGIIAFQQPTNGLFQKAEVERVTCIPWAELPHDTEHVRTRYFSQLHAAPVTSLLYRPEHLRLVSTSTDPAASMVVTHTMGKGDPYIFKTSKGICCMDSSADFQHLASGSADGKVRVWNPYVTSQPASTLTGHKSPIVDLVIHNGREMLFTFDKDAVLKAWCLKETTCLQNMHLKFPAFNIMGKKILYGTKSIFIPNESTIMATCCDYLTEVFISTPDELNGSGASRRRSEDKGTRSLSQVRKETKTKKANLRRNSEDNHSRNNKEDNFADAENMFEEGDSMMDSANKYSELESESTSYEQSSSQNLNWSESVIVEFEHFISKTSEDTISATEYLDDIWDEYLQSLKTDVSMETVSGIGMTSQDVSEGEIDDSCSIPRLPSVSLSDKPNRKQKSKSIGQCTEFTKSEGDLEQPFLPKLDVPSRYTASIHSLQAEHLPSQENINQNVDNGTPFCSLKTHQLEDIKFDPSLPVSAKMSERGMKCVSEKDLMRMNLDAQSSGAMSDITPENTRRHSTSSVGGSHRPKTSHKKNKSRSRLSSISSANSSLLSPTWTPTTPQ